VYALPPGRRGPASAAHLREFVQHNVGPAVVDRWLWNTWWSHADRATVGQVVDWLLAPGLKQAVTDAYLREMSPLAMEILNEVDQYL
jgi:hypothetical protein